MSPVEAPEAPVADPQSFFESPPASATELCAARRAYMHDAALADKFAEAARRAREEGNDAAALASWVNGDYAKALELADGKDALARFVRGSSHLELGRPGAALEELRNAHRSDDAAFAAAELHALAALHDFERLEKLLEKVTLEDADRRYFEARLAENAGEHEKAVEIYEEILGKDPDHLSARFRLAYRADLLGDDDRAVQEYEHFLDRRPIPVSVLINLGILYEDRNDFERACGCFGAILRRDPGHRVAQLYFTDAHDSLDMYYDENLELKEDQLMKVLRTPITDFELSVRARNCLANMDIKTLGDLVSHTEQELLEFKNFGETSLNEIKRVLSQKGLRLGMRREDGSFVIPEEFDAARNLDLERELSWLGELSEEQKEALELQISTLNLSVRCHRALVERLNLQRVGDILLYSEEDLLGMPNFGITSLNELQNKLSEYGLKLRSGRGEEMEQQG